MYIARCKACGNVMGAVRDPSRFTYLRCMACGIQNYIRDAVDPNERYDDPRETIVGERINDLESDMRKQLVRDKVIV